MYGKRFETWFQRLTTERGINQCLGNSIVLNTDIGLVRNENQDRVGALRTKFADDELVIIAVVDGMGGMRDGGRCATLAMSTFFHAFVDHRSKTLETDVLNATFAANNVVFDFSNGHGGSTLSALIVPRSGPALVLNVGDSRVYNISSNAIGRLTVDDSLREAVGGYGSELLQFIGMGEGIQPHITQLSEENRIAITTDGVHFVNAEVFEQVLLKAGSIRSASERVSALARWCGGPDNASSAFVDMKSLRQQPLTADGMDVEVWDPWGTLSIAVEPSPQSQSDIKRTSAPIADQSKPAPNVAHSSRADDAPRKPANKKTQVKRKRELKSAVQFEIEIGQPSGIDQPDENRN